MKRICEDILLPIFLPKMLNFTPIVNYLRVIIQFCEVIITTATIVRLIVELPLQQNQYIAFTNKIKSTLDKRVWTFFENRDIRDIPREMAQRTLQVFDYFLGIKLFSPRAFFSILPLSFLISFIAIVIGISLEYADSPSLLSTILSIPQIIESNLDDFRPFKLYRVELTFIYNFVLDYATLIVTIYCLKKFSRITNNIFRLGIVLVDLLVATILSIFSAFFFLLTVSYSHLDWESITQAFGEACVILKTFLLVPISDWFHPSSISACLTYTGSNECIFNYDVFTYAVTALVPTTIYLAILLFMLCIFVVTKFASNIPRFFQSREVFRKFLLLWGLIVAIDALLILFNI